MSGHKQSLKQEALELGKRAKNAARQLAPLSSEEKNKALLMMADQLEAQSVFLIEENEKDLEFANKAGASSAVLDRIALNPSRVNGMAKGLREVAALPDPVREVIKMWRRPNGLQVGRMRIPLGVIGIIYEARPNVTADAAALCLKSGNAVILRGGSEAIYSNVAIARVLQEEMQKVGIPAAALTVIPFVEREGVLELLKQEESIDLIIPRGGESLIRFVVEHSKIPVIKHYKGVCHIFVDCSADFGMAERIIVNAKTQRPGVCNALETLLIHKDVAETFVPRISEV